MIVRNRSSQIIERLPSYQPLNSTFHASFNQLYIKTKKLLNNNPNLMLTRADKRKVTVALDKDSYIAKIESMLSDKETYNILKKDSTKKLSNQLQDLLSKWKKYNYISNSTYRALYTSDSILSRACGLPKIHKTECPFRLIVSSLNSPLYNLAIYLHKIMVRSFPLTHSHVANSFQLIKRLSSIVIENEHILILLM